MKKYFLLVVSAVALAFTSCSDKEDIEIQYQVNFQISASDVLKPFIENEAGDFELDETESLRIVMFLYKDDGLIIDKFEQTINGYDKIVTFQKQLLPGKYSTICISNVISTEKLYSNDTYEYWSYSGENIKDNLTLKIDPINAGTASATLGLSEDDFIIDDESDKSFDIKLTPATGMGIVTYENCINSFIYNYYMPEEFTFYNTNFQFLYTAYNSMRYNDNNDWEYTNTLSKDHSYLYTFSMPVESYVDYFVEQGYQPLDLLNYSPYGYVVLLPGEFSLWCNYDKITSDGYKYDYGFGNSTNETPKIKIETGKSYDIIVNCEDKQISSRELSSTDRSKSTRTTSVKIQTYHKNINLN